MNSSWLKRSPIRYGGRTMETRACPKKTDRSPSTSRGARSGFVHAAGTPGARSAGCSAMARVSTRRSLPARDSGNLLGSNCHARNAASDGAEDLVRARVAESREIVGGNPLRLLIPHQHDLVADAHAWTVPDVPHPHVHADGPHLLHALSP